MVLTVLSATGMSWNMYLYFVELSGYPVLYSVTITSGQKLGFGSEIMQFKYEKIVGTTETDTIIEQIIVPLFVVYIYS